jgi:CheY-like chemotaxis protein
MPPIILLVDDTDVVRDAVSKDLRKHGYLVLIASNATEALRISEEHGATIDLLLTDVALLGMNGRELARHFLMKRPLSKVLCISSYEQGTVAAAPPDLDSGVLLYKPFSSMELLAAVSKLLGQQAH